MSFLEGGELMKSAYDKCANCGHWRMEHAYKGTECNQLECDCKKFEEPEEAPQDDDEDG